MSAATVSTVLDQATEMGGIEWIYFEGGEPFIHYALLEQGVRQAAARGFQVGLVTNAFWATDPEVARRHLQPFEGRVQDFTVSIDGYHGETAETCGQNALLAARALGIPSDVIRVAESGSEDVSNGKSGPGDSNLMYRGRAAKQLTETAPKSPGTRFDRCPWENLVQPGRVHLDPLGWVHVCQGITLGNFLQRSLRDILAGYDPATHPVVGPLLEGGPAELAHTLGTDCEKEYADACHLCYESRRAARERFPDALGPPQMYGDFGS